jgi:hypothetical protein
MSNNECRISNLEVLTSLFNIRNSVFDINSLNLIAFTEPCVARTQKALILGSAEYPNERFLNVLDRGAIAPKASLLFLFCDLCHLDGIAGYGAINGNVFTGIF